MSGVFIIYKCNVWMCLRVLVYGPYKCKNNLLKKLYLGIYIIYIFRSNNKHLIKDFKVLNINWFNRILIY